MNVTPSLHTAIEMLSGKYDSKCCGAGFKK